MGYQPTSTGELEYAIHMLGTTPGVIAAGIFVAIFFFTFMQRGRWFAVCLMLYMSMFGSPDTTLGHILIPPFDQLRFVSQPLTMLLLTFLLVPALFAGGRRKGTGLLGATMAFWLLEVVFATHVAISADSTRGTLSIATYTVVLISLGYGLSRWLRGADDVYAAVRCIACAGVLFVTSTVAQLIADRSAIIASGRLYAITGNPQHAAFMLAICLVPTCFLLASYREKILMRFVWGAVAGMIVVLLIWTGSRTGVLTALVGLGLAFRRRIGKLLGMGIIVAVFVFAFLAAFQVGSNTASRLVSTLDTRSETWTTQFHVFQSNLLFGKMGPNDWGPHENSYLTIASRCGLVGLCVLTLFLGLVVSACRRLGRLRAALESAQDRDLVDLAVAGLLGILAGSFFEGVLVGTLTFMLLSVYFYLGLIKFLINQVVESPDPSALQTDEGVVDDSNWLMNPGLTDEIANGTF